MIHLDDSEGLALTPMCRACEFHSSMSFERNEALLQRSTFVRQAYLHSLQEGVLALARQQAVDRERVNIALTEVTQRIVVGFVANVVSEQSADWSPGPPISEGSSHGNPRDLEVITIDSPPRDMPSTQRPDREPEVEQSPTQLESEPSDAQGQSSSLAQQTETATAGEIAPDDVEMRHEDAKDFEPDAAYGTYGGIANMYEAEAVVPMGVDLSDKAP